MRCPGVIKWRGTLIFISPALVCEPVGLEEIADGCWRVTFGPLTVGCLHADTEQLRPVDE